MPSRLLRATGPSLEPPYPCCAGLLPGAANRPARRRSPLEGPALNSGYGGDITRPHSSAETGAKLAACVVSWDLAHRLSLTGRCGMWCVAG